MIENVDWSLARFAKGPWPSDQWGNIEAKAKMDAIVTVCG
jgi:hypothetical protein